MSEDPIGLKSGDVNFYNYVLNRPVLAVDPSGEAFSFLFQAAAGALLGWVVYKLLPNPPAPAPYDPNKYPKVQPPHPYPESNRDKKEQEKKERENKEFKDRVCSV